MILDETTAGVDSSSPHLWRYIPPPRGGDDDPLTTPTSRGKALCEDVALIASGRIVARDTPEELMRAHDADSLEQVYMQTVSTSLPPAMAAEELG